MAAPTAPTLITLTTEALKKAGYSTPAAAALTRAQNFFMEEIKADIWMLCKDLRSLMTEGFVTTAAGLATYSFPTDYASLMKASLIYGNDTGTAQAGANGTITLAATNGSSENWLKGKEIYITGGTGSEQSRQVTALNTSTKVATVLPVWGTNPDNTSTYMLCDVQYPIRTQHLSRRAMEYAPTDKQRPIELHPRGDDDDGEFVLVHTPDKVYGVKLLYFADLMGIDLAGTLMATLYTRWRNIWIQGTFAKQLESDDDNRAQAEMTKYRGMLQSLVAREQYGQDLSELSITCEQ